MRCAVGCGLSHELDDEGGRVDEAVRGDRTHPVTEGRACVRGIREMAIGAAESRRLTEPLVRRNGVLEPATWAEALDRAAAGIESALDRSPDAVAVLGSGQQTTEAAYALGKLARGGFGTRNYDANTTLCMASAVTAYYEAFGSDAPPPTYDDVPAAETHLVWGANPAVAHPVLFQDIRASAAEADSRLLVVDPVRTETAEAADTHVALESGTDLSLARAVLAQLVDRGSLDEQFVAEQTTGFDELRARLPSPERAADGAGVPLETVEALAEAFTQPTLVYWGMGVNQSVTGTDTARALIDLCLATGNLEPGSGPFSLTGQANSMGTRVGASKGTWPGHRPFDDAHHREVVAEAWDVPVSRLPDDPGPGPVGILESVGEGVEAVYAVATNPVAGMPDANRVRERLEDAFLVVQDAFHTETVEYADVVLPARTWPASNGTVMNMERTISRVRPVWETPPGRKSDLEIVAALADRIVPGLLDPGPDPEAIFEEFAALTAGTPADCSGVSYDRLEDELAVRWPAPTSTAEGGYRYYDASTTEGRSETDPDRGGPTWSFSTASGRARFSSAVTASHPEPTDDAYPLTLTTARQAGAYNTGVRGRPDEPIGRVHPRTIEDGDSGEGVGTNDRNRVRVVTRRGSVTVRLLPDETVPGGLIWLPIHHPATNALTLPAVDPRSREPQFKACAARLESLEGSG